ncbi:MAG: hypothetical protein HYX22_00775 [Candidatus Yanofskybacteria bacterium]|nr:hypothetical protein [Candidatus Yanofskybacteria bacterium]
MNIVSIDTRDRFLKTVTVLTAIATIMTLSGIAYLVPTAFGATPADYGLTEGDTISAAGSDDPDVYIVNEMGYKRLFLNPAIFGLYGHLGGFAAVKNVSPATRDAFPTSGLFRVDGDEKVYGLETTGEDVANLRWVNTSGAQAVADDPDFFKKVFIINAAEKALYSTGADFTSVNDVPAYTRGGSAPAPIPSGPLSASLAPGNPAAATITRNAVGVEYLRFRLSGTGTVNTVTVKRAGAGLTADFGNVYVYEGATRVTSGKTFSSADGTLTFLLNKAVSGTKDLSIVGDMSTATAGDVNYIQLTGVTLTGGASVSGLPLNGNNFTVSGASSGTVTVAKSGSLSDPTVGQKQALLSEFKYTTATEGGTVKRVTMINGGTLKPADLTNVKLTTLTGDEWAGSTTSDGYVVFDLGSGKFIAKGGNAVFKVLGDVGGKKDETVDLYFEYDTDTNVIGDQYGQPMAVTDTALDSASDATTLTLQGGALTLTFVGPTATTVGTTVTDVTLLRYTVTAASNIEAKKHEFVLCKDDTGNGTYDAAADTTNGWGDLTDFKVWDEDLNAVVIGPQDGTAFTTSNSGACPNSVTGAEKSFTDTIDWAAGKTYNYKVTADITADDAGSGILLASGDILRAVLDDYSDDAGDVTVLKYSGTNTAVAAADIVPRADISGNNITLGAASLTLSLAGNPADQTKIKGTKDVNVVGIIFAAGQASALKVTTIKITGYAAENPAGSSFDEGVAELEDTGVTVANAMAKVQLYEAESGSLIAGTDKVTSNILGTSGTGTMTFSNLNWNIPAGTSKTVLVKADLSSNAASGDAGDGYAFDIAATADVTALDSDSNTVNAGNQKVNGTAAAPTQVLTVKNSGSMTLAASSDSPQKGALYWGQTNAPVSKFRLSSTDEGQYIEKLTIAASNSTENTNAKNNVKTVFLTYKNKAGSTLTTSQSMGNAASVNFAWAAGNDNRPYVPQDSSLDVSVNVDMKTKAEGATPTNASPGSVYFGLDLVDSFNGSYTNGFRAVGDGSGSVIDGTSSGINDVSGPNDQYVYRVYPKFAQVDLASPYNLIGTPTVFKFSITAMGLGDSTLRFDNEAVGSGSIKFEIVSSGEYTYGTSGSTTYTIYDESGVTIDTASSAGDSKGLAPNASLSFNFSSKDVEISGGLTKTFRIQINNPNDNYSKPSATGRGADFFQVTLLDDADGLINWVADYNNALTATDTSSIAGTLRSLPLYGPTFQR